MTELEHMRIPALFVEGVKVRPNTNYRERLKDTRQTYMKGTATLYQTQGLHLAPCSVLRRRCSLAVTLRDAESSGGVVPCYFLCRAHAHRMLLIAC